MRNVLVLPTDKPFCGAVNATSSATQTLRVLSGLQAWAAASAQRWTLSARWVSTLSPMAQGCHTGCSANVDRHHVC